MNEVDSLEARLSVVSDPKEKITLRLALVETLRHQDLPRAIAYCEDAVEMAAQKTLTGVSYPLDEARCRLILGELYTDNSDYEQGFEQFREAQKIYASVNSLEGQAKALKRVPLLA